MIGAVAHNEARLVIDKVDVVQARKGVQSDRAPFDAGVLGEEKDPDTSAVGKFLTTGDPAGEQIEEVDRPERGADAGRLAFPGRAPVDGVPDHALVADGPALAAVHELDGVQGSIVEMPEIAGQAAGSQHGAQDERCQDRAHGKSSSRGQGSGVRGQGSGVRGQPASSLTPDP